MTPAWLEDALRDLRGRVHTKELKCFLSSFSEELLVYILKELRPQEVSLDWGAEGLVPRKEILACPALKVRRVRMATSFQSATHIELTSAVTDLDLSHCHPHLLHLKVSCYIMDDAAELNGLLLQVSQAMTKTNLLRIQVTVVLPVSTDVSFPVLL